MRPSSADKSDNKDQQILLELTVNNHPGVMSHICGLFSRRAYNLEKILCFPISTGLESRMWLQVGEEQRLEQVIKQIEKLEDVLRVEHKIDNGELFRRIEEDILSQEKC